MEKFIHIVKNAGISLSKRKAEIMAELIIDNEKYMQIEYIDYELSENDSIYEVSDIETELENEETNIDLDNDVMNEEI